MCLDKHPKDTQILEFLVNSPKTRHTPITGTTRIKMTKARIFNCTSDKSANCLPVGRDIQIGGVERLSSKAPLFGASHRVIDHARRQLRYRHEIPEVATAP